MAQHATWAAQRSYQVAITMGTGMMMVCTIGSILIIRVARRGPYMRALGLEFATRRRKPASRLRLLWRQVIVWSAPLAFFSLLVTSVFGGSEGLLLPATLIGGAFVLGVWSALRRPARGLSERLSGTWIVRE